MTFEANFESEFQDSLSKCDISSNSLFLAGLNMLIDIARKTIIRFFVVFNSFIKLEQTAAIGAHPGPPRQGLSEFLVEVPP